MKTCIKCGVEQSREEFHRQAATSDGLQAHCKACQRAAYRAYYAANRTREMERHRAYYAEHREEHTARLRVWREANTEKRRAYDAAHREERNAYKREWARARPDKWRADCAKRRARKKGAGGTLTPGLRWELNMMQFGECNGCRQALDNTAHLDHIMPLALGGQHVDSNMQLLCPKCNSSKGAKHPDEWKQQIGVIV